MGPGRAQDRTQARVWMAPPRDSNRLLGLSDFFNANKHSEFTKTLSFHSLIVWISLVDFLARTFLAKMAVLSCFSRVLKRSAWKENP